MAGPEGELGRAMCVLVVEDDYLVSLCLEDILGELGFGELHFARDLTTGHALLNKIRPAFALLDVNLGRELVFPLAATLAYRKIPFAFSTGNARLTFPPEWRQHVIVYKPPTKIALARALQGIGISTDTNPTDPCAASRHQPR